MNGRLQVTVAPTIVLPGLDPKLAVEEYFRGDSSQILFFEGKIKIPRTSEDGIINAVHGASLTSDTFSFNTRTGIETVFVTTNNANFRCYHLGNVPTEPRECRWCTLMFTDGMGGIPVAVTPEYTDDGKVIPAVWTKGNICDYECALAKCMETKCDAKVEGWIRMMHRLTYPDAPRLEPAPDPSHLTKHGGNYSPEEYKKKRYTFIDTHTFVMYPAKPCYRRVIR